MKYIKKTFKFLIVTLMLILMVSSVCLAGEEDGTTGNYNGGQQDTDKTHGTADQYPPEEQGLGFSTVATGYRFYIAEYETDVYGSVHSLKSIITPDAVDIYMSKPDKDGYKIDRYDTLKEEFKTGITDGDFLGGAATFDKNNVARLGRKHVIRTYVKNEIDLTIGLPAPILYDNPDFLPNGQAFREWMLKPCEGGDKGVANNGTALISQLWGEDMLTEFLENDNYRLVVEPIMWSSEYVFESYDLGSYWTTESNKIFLGTAQEWAYYMMKTGDPSGLGLSTDASGKGCYINVIYSNALPRSMVLQETNSVFRAVDLAGDILATGTLWL